MLNQILENIVSLDTSLENHSLYEKIKTKRDLCFFMERHVFAVLDFMSLLNSLKRNLLPTNTFWTPREDSDISRFLNEIILGEESDKSLDGAFISHFELYCQAMKEIGANTDLIYQFIEQAKHSGVSPALEKLVIPKSSEKFTRGTFNLIEENAIHKIAASFCFGREKCIPKMFKSILEEIKVHQEDAPKFYYYINRHIEVDGDEHGPMSEKLLSLVCQNDQTKWIEAKETALASLRSRCEFWDNIEFEMIESSRTT